MKKEKKINITILRAKRDLRNFQIFSRRGNRPEKMILQATSSWQRYLVAKLEQTRSCNSLSNSLPTIDYRNKAANPSYSGNWLVNKLNNHHPDSQVRMFLTVES